MLSRPLDPCSIVRVQSWDAEANATSYTLSRSGSSSGPFTAIAQLTTNSFTDTNVLNGGTYYYVIHSANLTGQSADSLPVSAQLVSLTPPNLSFTASGGALQFNIPGRVFARVDVAKPVTGLAPSNGRDPQYFFKLGTSF